MNDSILSIIPARSGSKGLKDKNIKELNGKPMIAYTIEAALKSGIFKDVIVSTDSTKYAEISKKYGAQVPFIRPKELANDYASSNDVVLHVLEEMEKLGKKYDYFMLLQPTSPLRTAKHIIEAYELLQEKDANSVVSVCEVDHSPLLMNTLDDSLSLDKFIDKKNIKRRQDLPKYFRINGAIYLAKVEHFVKYKNFYKEKSFAYIMDKKESIDIDNEIDFQLAQILMKK